MADVRKLKEKATEAFSKGKFVKAAEAYAEYCEADPKDLQARLRMGDAWSKGGKKEKAIEAYTWAAEGFAKDGFLPRAIAASKLILELDPSHKGVQKMLADLYARKTTAPGSQSSSRAASSLKVETRVETQTTAAGFTNRKDAIELDAKPAAAPKRAVSAAVPEAAPTPMNRKDAIDLPEYEIPGMEPESASGSASVPMAKRGPSPTRREDAIEIEEEDTGPKGPRALQDTQIELDVSVTGTSPMAVPPAPKPSAPEMVVDLEVEVPITGVEVKTPEPPPPPKAPEKPAESYELEVKAPPEPPPPPPAPPRPAEPQEKVWDLSEEAEEIEEVQELEVVETTTSEEIQLVDVAEPAPSAPPKPPKPQLEVIPEPPKAKPQLKVIPDAPKTAPGEFSGSFQITVEGEQSGSFKPPPAEPRPEPVVAAAPPPPPPPPPEPPAAKLSEGEQSGSFRISVSGEESGTFKKDAEKSGSFPPGMKPRKAATQEVPVAAAPLPAPSSVAPPPSSPRIWLPGNFNAPAAPEAGVSSAEAEFTSAPEPAGPPPAAGSLTDLERGLQIFSSFDAEDFRPTKPAAAPPPPPEPPAPGPVVAAPAASAPGGRRTFTELELEGDSLLHAVETAAAVGVEQRGEATADGVEEAMEMPDDQKQLPPGELPKIPLFSDLPPDAFIALFERCPLKRAEPGDVIIQQGSLGDSFYVICAGSVKVYRMDGEQRREIATLEEGAFFGEMALLSGSARAASVEAATEDTQLLEISAPILTELSHRYPQVATALKKFCRQRLLSNLMASATIFQPFSRQDRRDLVQRFKARDVQKGDVLIKEGTRSDGMYVILSGEVEVRVGPTQVASLKEGDVFGEMSLLTKANATATVAASKRTSLLRLPREDFDLIIMSHPQVLVLVSELTDSRAKQNAAIASHRPATADAAPMI